MRNARARRAEEAELGVLSKYLPEPLSEDEVSAIIDAAIADAAQAVGRNGCDGSGHAAGDCGNEGRADGKSVSGIVRQRLQG